MADHPPSLRHRIEYLRRGGGRGSGPRAADAGGARRRPAARAWRSTPLDGAHRRLALRNLEAAFPVRSDAERRAIARRHVHALRPAAHGAAQVQHHDAGGDARARRVRRRRPRARGARAAARRAAVHRALRVLGDQRPGPRADPASDGRAGPAARQPAAARPARIGPPRTGNSVIYRRGAIRRVLRALEANQAVAVLIDQHIQTTDAVYVDFFNRPAATTSALAALALRTGAPVMPVFALPLPGGRFRMVYEHAVDPPPSDDPDAIREFTQRCTDVLEMYVRRYPGSVAVDAPPLARRRADGTAGARGMFPTASGEEQRG